MIELGEWNSFSAGCYMILGGLVFSTMVSEKKASVHDVTAPKISSESAGEDDKV